MLLFRRAGRDAFNSATGGVKAVAFKLRTSKGELSLSFYDGTLVSPEEVQRAAPAPGWGVAEIRVAELRALGFAVTSEVAGTDVLGRAHVSATPPETTASGQLPPDLSRSVALAARWVIEPSR